MTPIPQSPFLSSACPYQAEALPATVPGKDHSPPAGRCILIDEESFLYAIDPPPLPPLFIERALFELSR
jgi:hypothetical protein